MRTITILFFLFFFQICFSQNETSSLINIKLFGDTIRYYLKNNKKEIISEPKYDFIIDLYDYVKEDSNILKINSLLGYHYLCSKNCTVFLLNEEGKEKNIDFNNFYKFNIEEKKISFFFSYPDNSIKYETYGIQFTYNETRYNTIMFDKNGCTLDSYFRRPFCNTNTIDYVSFNKKNNFGITKYCLVDMYNTQLTDYKYDRIYNLKDNLTTNENLYKDTSLNYNRFLVLINNKISFINAIGESNNYIYDYYVKEVSKNKILCLNFNKVYKLKTKILTDFITITLDCKCGYIDYYGKLLTEIKYKNCDSILKQSNKNNIGTLKAEILTDIPNYIPPADKIYTSNDTLFNFSIQAGNLYPKKKIFKVAGEVIAGIVTIPLFVITVILYGKP